MQELLRWLASLQGIPADDVEMQFEFASFPSGGLGLAVLALLALLVVFVTYVYRRDGKTLVWRVATDGLRPFSIQSPQVAP
jgi:hypothetical protein